MNVLTVVIVNYNSTDFLVNCLESLAELIVRDGYQVVVVDNASEDQDFSQISATYPRITFITNEVNRGFAMACNQGLRRIPAKNYLLLNPDCVVDKGAVEECLAFLQGNIEIGIVGCRVTNPDGSLQLACRRRIPRPSTAFYRLSGLSRLFPNSPRLAAYNLQYVDDGEAHEVEAVSGSFLMFSRHVLKDTGGLDERFFLYGEDLDFCYRAANAGWKIYYYPSARVTHHKNASSRQDIGRTTYHFYKAMDIFYRKHFYTNAGRIERAAVISGISLLYWLKRAKQILFRSSEIGSSW